MNQRKVARSIDRARAALSEIEAEVLVRPEPEPEPEPPRPESEPEEPAAESAVFQLDRLRPVELTPENPWSTIGGWLHVRAWFEPRGVTVYCANAYPNMGRRKIGSLKVTVGRETALAVKDKPLPPKYAYLASTIPDSAESWSDVRDDRWFPAWAEGRVQGEIESHSGLVLDHPVWWFDRNPDAPAGHGVAPFEGGSHDWLCGPEGKRLRWRQVLGELWTNVHTLDPETGEPARFPAPWWTGNVAANQLEGYEWQPQTAEEHTLWARGRMHDGYHRRRAYGQCAALAKWSEPARWLLGMVWNDCAQEWSMDEGHPRAEHPLLMPLFQRIEESAPGKRFAPPNYNSWGNRGLAHAINTLCETAPLIETEEARGYAAGFAQLATNLHDENGICGRDASGDSGQWSGDPFNMVPPFSMQFHQQLVTCALDQMYSRFGIAEVASVANRTRAYLTDSPPPYGVESGVHRHRTGETIWNRKHTPHTAYPGYTVATHRQWIDVDGWHSFEEMDALAQRDSLTGLPRYSCVPPELRGGR